MEELGLPGQLHPRVTVQLVDTYAFRDTESERIGIIVERAVQDGLQREILAALRRDTNARDIVYVIYFVVFGT